jgi:hypothetical protein
VVGLVERFQLLWSVRIVEEGRGFCEKMKVGSFDMDMSYARKVRTASHTSYSISCKVLHQRTASRSSHTSHSVSHK